MIAKPALPRVLNTPGVAILASASMGPAYSIAVTMGPMVAAAGSSAPLALAALSFLMLCVAIGFGRMAKSHPNAGSSYGWAETAFGKHAGAYAAWLLLLSNFFATMATALPAGIYTIDLLAPQYAGMPIASAFVGTAWIVASAILLAAGLRPTARVSAAFLLAELAVLGAAAVAVLIRVPAGAADAVAATAAGAGSSALAFPPLASAAGLAGFAGAMVLGIWMSDGWEVSASASEETTDTNASERGGIAGLLVTTGVLLLAMFAFLRLGPSALAAHQTNVLDYVAESLGGGVWKFAIALIVLISTAATLWTTMLYLSRSIYAMGRSGVLPPALGRLDAKGGPALANDAVAVGVGLATLATGFIPTLAQALQLIINGTSVFLGLLFVMSVAAGAKLAGAGDRLAGAIVPGIGGAGLLAIVAITLQQADLVTRWIDLGGLALGLPFVLWRGRR